MQLNQAVKPYSFDVVKCKMLLIFYYEILKMKLFSSLVLKNNILAAIWLESFLERLLTNGLHYFNKREQD